MQSAPRPEAQAAARQFVAAHFPTCLVALLGTPKNYHIPHGVYCSHKGGV